MASEETSGKLRLKIFNSIADIEGSAWNALANPEHLAFDPFVSYEFLAAMELSGSATVETGWAAYHLGLYEDDSDKLIGAMPLYAKTHSQGEYIFDHAWADAFMRAGGSYYPKLLSAVPFTPVTGRRLLLGENDTNTALSDALIGSAVSLAEQNSLSSLNLNFVDQLSYEALGASGLLQRTDQQFHFINNNYSSFDDFLEQLASRKRKNLRKEREAAQEGLRFEWVTGSDLTEAHWDQFFVFYQDTGSRKWGMPYLTREAFSMIGESLADHTALIFAYDGERPIAGALNMIGGEALYGRYWGCTEYRPFLHFEVCYYQAIDYAIERGLKRVEAGAQGQHKLARGYVPTPTYSLHHITNPDFRRAIAQYLDEERLYAEGDMEYLKSHLPFKADV